MQTWRRPQTWLMRVGITSLLLCLNLPSLISPVGSNQEARRVALSCAGVLAGSIWAPSWFLLPHDQLIWSILLETVTVISWALHVYVRLCMFSWMFSHRTALILRPWKMSVWEIFLSFNDRGSDIMDGPEFELNSSFTVTRCPGTDLVVMDQ